MKGEIMDLDEQLEQMESYGETELEYIDQETQLEDFESDEDEIFGADAAENDLEHAYDSFMTNNEADYNGWDAQEIEDEVDAIETSDILHSEGYHVEDFDIDESQIIEMEIEEGDIKAFISDAEGKHIGFVIEDETGEKQTYYYASEDNGGGGVAVFSAEDGEEIDLALDIQSIEDSASV